MKIQKLLLITLLLVIQIVPVALGASSNIDSRCTTNGMGTGECTFNNTGKYPGSICVQIELTNIADRYKRDQKLTSTSICSGKIADGEVVQRRFAAVFPQDPSNFCTSSFGDRGSWRVNCSMTTKVVEEFVDQSIPQWAYFSGALVVLILIVIFFIATRKKSKSTRNENRETVAVSQGRSGNRSYSGERSLASDAYKVFLVEQYGIEKKEVLGKFYACERLFDSIDHALEYCHATELERMNKNVPIDPYTAIGTSGWKYRHLDDGSVEVINQYGGARVYDSIESARAELTWWE